MKTVNLALINDRRKTGSDSKPAPVELRITYNRKVKYINTGVKVIPKHWKDGRVVRDADSFAKNKAISEIYADVLKIVTSMEERGMVDIEAIPRMLEKKAIDSTFWDYIEERAESKVNITEATRRRYRSFLATLKAMDMFMCFSEITEGNIRRFDEALHRRGYTQQTVHGYHKHMKTFINDAVIDGYLKENIYHTKRIIIKRGASRIDNYLSVDEVKMLAEAPLVGKLAKARDLFIVSCFTGLAYSDLMLLTKDKICSLNGTLYVRSTRKKTGQEYVFALVPQVVRILEAYHYNLPRISNQKYNDYLKVLSHRVGINKEITSHWARHTSAMLMLNSNISIEVVSKVLGHSSIKTTQQSYAKLQDQTVLNEFRKLKI